MANYTKTTIGKENRIELHEKLSLTGAEISLNELPAGANVPNGEQQPGGPLLGGILCVNVFRHGKNLLFTISYIV